LYYIQNGGFSAIYQSPTPPKKVKSKLEESKIRDKNNFSRKKLHFKWITKEKRIMFTYKCKNIYNYKPHF